MYYSTNDLFFKLKILILEQLYNKLSITKVYMNKSELEFHNTYYKYIIQGRRIVT